jgi:Tfp pilus assembly protein FimT
MRNQEGATLAEVAVVILFAALLAGAAVPNLHGLVQRWSLWGGARLVETSLQWGRMHAVSINAALAFHVDPGGRRFYWSDPTSGETYESTVRILPGRVRMISWPASPLRFYQRGNAAPAGTYVLQGQTGTCRVIVNPAGRIRIQWN